MMDKIFNASYKFTFGEINFQIDLDETLSSEQKLRDYPVTKNKAFHDHPFYEMFFTFDGETSIVFENGTQKYQNSIVCLPPATKHYNLRSSDFRILFSHTEKNGSKGNFAKFIAEFLAADSVCEIPITASGLRGYLEELCRVFYNQKNELDREVIASILKCILYSVYSSYNDSESVKKQDYFASESRYIIISSLITRCTTPGSEITVAAIADELCLSKKQTSRLIYKYYGRHLSEIITDEKLNYAAYLLKNTDISIYDVAFESNFHSYSYFCQLFKKKFGTVPLNYRKEG